MDELKNEKTPEIGLSIFEKMLYYEKEYFEKNTKNKIFKKNQKFDCAKYICDNIDINRMIETAVFIIPEKNIIFVDYVIFKIFAYDDIYDRIIDHIMNLFDYAIKYYRSFEVNLNLRTFTVSAAERFIPAISKFCKRCLSHHTNYTEHMNFFRIINTPLVMEMIIKIVKPVVEKDVLEKLSFLSKDETVKFCNDNNYRLISDIIQK